MSTKPVRRAFTLVEMLVVITIIGILAALITGAAVVARTYVKRATIISEIKQIDGAMETYRTEIGEYPPDDLTDVAAVNRHLRKRFPNYGGVNPYAQMRADLNAEYGIPLNARLDQASAILFWLSGLPETYSASDPTSEWLPAGFNADKAHPFKQGGSRTTRFFDPDKSRIQMNKFTGTDRYTVHNGTLRYYAAGLETPLVYFRAHKDTTTNNRWEYGVVSGTAFAASSCNCGLAGIAAPYMDGEKPESVNVPWATASSNRAWRNSEKFQIISTGLDDTFGDGSNGNLRLSKRGNGFTEGDMDNLTNFAQGRLEDEIQ
jgi:prepilin-type N-terminal cleavage/methylation domain-containing protein